MGTLYFRQLRAGVDFGVDAPYAQEMQNFVYVIGDEDTREVLLVDPAWAVEELVSLLAADDMRVTGALVTHYHPDHVGGDLWGLSIDGLASLLTHAPCPIHVHELEADGVRKVTGVSKSDLVTHVSGDRVTVGDIEVELLHTPGHTPGSLCFRLDGRLVAGDTLFLQGCGRVDLPGADPEAMFHSLRKLATLPSDTVLCPGHAYGGDCASLGEVKRMNHYLQIPDLETWKRLMG